MKDTTKKRILNLLEKNGVKNHIFYEDFYSNGEYLIVWLLENRSNGQFKVRINIKNNNLTRSILKHFNINY